MFGNISFTVIVVKTVIELEETQQMGYTDNNYAAHTHSYTRPNWAYPNVPFVKYSSYYWHDQNVVTKCPE
jgi:hypothetical protein